MSENGKITKAVIDGKEFDVDDNGRFLGGFSNIPDVLNCIGKTGTAEIIDDNENEILIEFKCISSSYITKKGENA